VVWSLKLILDLIPTIISTGERYVTEEDLDGLKSRIGRPLRGKTNLLWTIGSSCAWWRSLHFKRVFPTFSGCL